MKLYLHIRTAGYWNGFATTNPNALPTDFTPVETIQAEIKPINFDLQPNGTLSGSVGSMRISLSELSVENCFAFQPKCYKGRQSSEDTWQLIHKSFLSKLESGFVSNGFDDDFFDNGFGAYVFEAA